MESFGYVSWKKINHIYTQKKIIVTFRIHSGGKWNWVSGVLIREDWPWQVELNVLVVLCQVTTGAHWARQCWRLILNQRSFKMCSGKYKIKLWMLLTQQTFSWHRSAELHRAANSSMAELKWFNLHFKPLLVNDLQKWRVLASFFFKYFLHYAFVYLCLGFPSTFIFFLPGNQGELNMSQVLSHSFPSFIHSFQNLFNSLQFDMGQSITRKWKTQHHTRNQEGNRTLIISLFTSK